MHAIRKEWLLERDKWLPLLSKNQTLYIGGGTPSLCPLEELQPFMQQILDDIKSFGNEITEVTIEANPCDISPEYCKAWLEMGINRLSIGIQSFHDDHLAAMNRRHTARQAIEAVWTARQAGFRNINIDLLFGFPDLSMEQWEATLHQAIELAPEHISAYQLSLDPPSLWEQQATLPSEDTCFAQYTFLQGTLKTHGYKQYEISSFCRPGKEAIHNSRYWQRIPYLGLGPSAHSFNGRNRYANVYHISKYMNGLRKRRPYRRHDYLTRRNVSNEWIMLQLRTTAGFSLEQLEARKGRRAVEVFLSRIDSLMREGVLIQEDERILIPPSLFFIADRIIENCLQP